MMNKLTKTLIAGALASSAGSAVALDDIAGNVTLATDYVFRGVSQTNNKGAIQGGLDWGYDTGWNGVGLYIGAWGSNIDQDFFADNPVMELDGYAGIAGDIGDSGFSYDAGWLRYFYPGGRINDTTEWHIGGGWKWFGATYYYSKDWFATDESASRIEGSFDYDLPYEIGFSATVANNYGDGNEAFWNDSYVDWSLGLSKTWLGVDWGFTYTDTDISASDCGDEDLCDSTFILSASKSF